MTSFVETPLLRVACELGGPADSFPVIIAHGWPDDVRTWEARFDPVPKQRVPTLTMHGALDPVNSPQASEGREAYFIGPCERRLVDGAGHFPQRERPDDVAAHVVEWLRRYR